jgi:tRNA pseudouridine32 synthase/23S rRNA pseudouridine746 synthase
MSGLGVPILGDDFYPVLTETPLGDFTRPLQLLAKVLEFPDPITDESRRFESKAVLKAWTSFEEWSSTRADSGPL